MAITPSVNATVRLLDALPELLCYERIQVLFTLAGEASAFGAELDQAFRLMRLPIEPPGEITEQVTTSEAVAHTVRPMGTDRALPDPVHSAEYAPLITGPQVTSSRGGGGED